MTSHTLIEVYPSVAGKVDEQMMHIATDWIVGVSDLGLGR
jgi:hypothetical protein